MAYTAVFGGGTLYPAQQTYLALSYSADTTLVWPLERNTAGNVVANIMDLNPSAGGFSIIMPDARDSSLGIQVSFNNVSAFATTIKDSTGGTIVSIPAGTAWIVYLTSNATQAGTWKTFQLGSLTTTANAGSLAGFGVKAIGSTLNQNMPVSTGSATPFSITTSQRAGVFIYTGGVGTCNLPAAGTAGSDFFFMIRNSGSGNLTVTPAAGTIDGSATLTLSAGRSAIIFTDGSNWFTIGLGTSGSSTAFDYISISVAGTGDYTLSGAELNRISYRFTGVLTGNRKIIVPNTIQQYWVDNSTTGAFTLSVATAAQVGPPTVTQGARVIFYCDGTNVLNANTETVSFPLTVVQGGTGSTTAAGALTNLGAVPTTRLVSAGTGISGGGDLSADRTISLDTANTRNVDHTTVTITAGAGLTGGGDISANRTIDVGAGTGITVAADTVGLDTANTRNVDHTAVTITAGTGLSGGGDISANRTITVDRSGTDTNQVGYLDIPQNHQSGNYTTVMADRGKHIYHDTGDGAGDTYTIPANASVAYPIGSALTFINHDTNSVSIAITTDTMLLAGTTSTGTRTLAQNGVATAIKVLATVWIISGPGLT